MPVFPGRSKKSKSSNDDEDGHGQGKKRPTNFPLREKGEVFRYGFEISLCSKNHFGVMENYLKLVLGGSAFQI